VNSKGYINAIKKTWLAPS